MKAEDKNKKTKQNGDGIELGGHIYNIVDVSSRFFGPMFIILKDGVYHKRSTSERDSLKMILEDQTVNL